MKIGLLMAGENLGAMAEKHGTHDSQFIELFNSVVDANTPKIEWKIYHVLKDEFPKSVDECDAYMISGSKHGVYENMPWMVHLAEFTRKIVAAKKRLTGICFGHQIIAHALGGKVVKVEQGFGIGLHEYKVVIPSAIAHLAQIDGLALKTSFSVNIMHGDQVVELPDSAEIIASSEFCEFAGLYYPDGILTFQGHPEFDNQTIKDLIKFKWSVGHSWIDEAIVEDALSADDVATDRLPIAKFMLNFMTEKVI